MRIGNNNDNNNDNNDSSRSSLSVKTDDRGQGGPDSDGAPMRKRDVAGQGGGRYRERGTLEVDIVSP